jgi:hypothetical protein
MDKTIKMHAKQVDTRIRHIRVYAPSYDLEILHQPQLLFFQGYLCKYIDTYNYLNICAYIYIYVYLYIYIEQVYM